MTDINLGACIDGIELAQLARAASASLGVILITGLPDNFNRHQSCPGDVLLRKPFGMGDLLRAVQAFITPTPQAA